MLCNEIFRLIVISIYYWSFVDASGFDAFRSEVFIDLNIFYKPTNQAFTFIFYFSLSCVYRNIFQAL